MAIRIRLAKIIGAIVALPSSVSATMGHLLMSPSVPFAATVTAGAVGAMTALTLLDGGDPLPLGAALIGIAALAEVGRHAVAKDKAAPFLEEIAGKELALAERRREVAAREGEVARKAAEVAARGVEVEALLASASASASMRQEVSLRAYRRAKTASRTLPRPAGLAPVSVDDVLRGRHV